MCECVRGGGRHLRIYDKPKLLFNLRKCGRRDAEAAALPVERMCPSPITNFSPNTEADKAHGPEAVPRLMRGFEARFQMPH